MTTVVVLGAGHWHLPLHRDALRAHHRVVGVRDTDPQAATRAGVGFGAPVFHTVADAVAAGPDLAYVLGVHDQMPGICRQLIAARIPFLLEKPGAAAVADLAAVRDDAQAADVAAAAALVVPSSSMRPSRPARRRTTSAPEGP